MLEVAVYNTDGEKIDTLKVDERIFGGKVNIDLLKQAVVTYHANRRQGTRATRGRSRVKGSTRKVFRQKGTGSARRGAVRSNIVRGGGVAFGKSTRDYRKKFPQKMRRRALASAILAKILGGDLMIVDGLTASEPGTRWMSGVMKNLKINRSCVLTLAQDDRNIYLSARNLPDVTVRIAGELNAFDVATRQKMLVTTGAMKALMERTSPETVEAEVGS